MKTALKNFIITILAILIVTQPFLIVAQIKMAEAADTQASDSLEEQVAQQIDSSSGGENGDLNFDGGSATPASPSVMVPDAIKNIGNQIAASASSDGSAVTMQDSLTGFTSNPRIILNADDAQAVRSLYCLSSIMIDFENDIPGLYNNIPANQRPATQAELLTIKMTNPEKFNTLVTAARKNWGDNNRTVILNDMSTLSCLTGFSQNQIVNLKQTEPAYLTAVVDDTINSLVVDIRVLKTLVYLATPKNQGGAGHYRITVQRIRSGYTSEASKFTRESDAVKEMINQNKPTPKYTEPNEFGGKTAAEIGMSREVVSTSPTGSLATSPATSADPTATATVEDTNGDKYNAYLNSIHEDDKTISAHKDGEAIDISEIDDIRCTLIKYKRVGGNSKKKYSVQPIKLAWQTQAGYDASGGNSQADLGNLFKQMAGDNIKDLVSSLGGDITQYQGDLSKGNFSDIVNLIGKSLLSQVLNSPGGNLSGYDIQDTIQKLGSMYFADFLGLPRQIFIGQKITSLEDLQRIVGQAAIEDRLSLPYGTFSGDNLDTMLTNVGQRKIEFEMGLDSGGLDGFTKSPNIPLLIGQSLIEQTLGLRKGSFRGNSFSEIKTNIGKYKAEALFIDLTYIDNDLHLEPGTAKKFKTGAMSPIEFATLVGKTRLDDTAYGLKYFAAHDSKYNLPAGTWDGALLGKTDNLKTVGISMISKVFADTDDQRAALTAWLVSNTAKTGTACVIPDQIVQQVTITAPQTEEQIKRGEPPVTETKTVTISESKALSIGLAKGDIFRIFGCADTNGQAVFERVGSKILYYAFANYILNPEEKAKINLLDTNPSLRISDPTIKFYLDHITTIKTLSTRIKDNWKDIKNDPDYQYIMDTIDSVIAVATDPKYQATVASAQSASRQISVKIDAMKTRFEARKTQGDLLVNKINGTLSDLSALVRAVTEIMEGNSVPSSDLINFGQIPVSVLTPDSGTASGSTKTGPKQINKRTIFLLLAGKVNPVDFFISLGTDQVESSLGLPTNSILYYIQNTEKKGMNGKDAFYESIGQAKIEQTFGMPSYYFQGPVLTGSSGMPDYKHDINALMDYLSVDKTNETLKKAISDLRVNNPEFFNQIVNDARKAYLQKMGATINSDTNKQQDNNLYDVKKNVDLNKLTDGMRSADLDILFRMGLTGNLDSLTSGSLVAWANNATRATAIDKQFSLNDGTTKTLFTGNAAAKTNGENLIDKDEKALLAGKMQVSTAAIEKLLAALNGNISVSELDATGKGIFYNSSNPYAPVANPLDGTCPIGFTLKGGIQVSDNIFEPDSYVYVDADGAHSFGSQSDAQTYATQHSDKAIDFLTEIATGLSRVNQTYTKDEIRPKLLDYIKNPSTKQLFDDATYNEIEITSDIPSSLLTKLFDRKNIASVTNTLQAYKKAVGLAEAKKVISWRLFSAFGINIDPSMFGPDDLYQVLNGNYSALTKIGSRMVESKLNLPQGTIQAIVGAKSPALRNCAVAEAGANLLGGLVGLNYISLKGNIFQNIGASRAEQVLGLPRNSFHGATLDELMRSTSYIDFAIAFKIPVYGVISDQILSGFFAPDYVASIKSNSDAFKLKKIKDYLTMAPSLPSSSVTAFATLNLNLYSRIQKITKVDAPHWNEGFSVSADKQEYAAEIKTFLANLTALDAQLSLPKDATKLLLTGQNITVKNILTGAEDTFLLTPDRYRDMVAKSTVAMIAAMKIGEMLGLDDEQVKGAINLVRNISNWIDNKKYGDIFTALSQLFNLNLDKKAGFDPGTIAAMLNNPSRAPIILIGQAIKDFDAKLHLDPNSSNSFSAVYKTYVGASDRCDSAQVTVDREKAIQAQRKDLNYNLLKSPGANSNTLNLQSPSNTSADANTLRLLDQEEITASNAYASCKKDAVINAEHGGIEIVTNMVAQTISTEIAKITEGSVVMPVADVKNLALGGDLRYLQAATMAFAANKVLYDDTGKSEMVPPSMRIAYADIKLALIGDPGAEAYAADAATYNLMHGDPAANPTVPNRPGDVCQNFTLSLNCILSTRFIATVGATPRTQNDLIQGNKDTSNLEYGFDATKQVATQLEYNQLETDTQICSGMIDGSPSRDCQDVIWDWNTVSYARSEAIDASRKKFQEDVQYRGMDGALWKLDHNIFPGFSYAMMKGDSSMRNQALATYISNGVIRGEIMGIKIGDGFPDLPNWLRVGQFVNDIISDQNAGTRLDTFAENGGLTFLSGFITSHSKEWLGFEMPAGTIEALAVGFSTGEWGWGKTTNTKFDRLDNPQYYKTTKGIQIKTLQEVLQGEVTRRIFAWADKALGLPVGSAFQMYTGFQQMQNSIKLYKTLKTLKTAADAATASKAAQEALKAAGGDLAKAQSASKANMTAAKANFITLVITVVFAKQIAAAEQALGLVPGTGAMLVGMMVSLVMGAAVAPLTIAIFILMNLFGVYKTELKCSADGYYPAIDTPTSPSIGDVSGLGEWNGMLPNVTQQKSIQAAQYKAKRLILDAMEMQNNPQYADVIPSQIMTGRDQDVKDLNSLIEINICSKMGMKSVGGVCGGDTRAGVWANPQTVAWTHIGY